MPHLPLLPAKDLSKSAQLNENPKKRNAKHHLNIAEDSNELLKLPQLPERSLLNWPKLALTRFICCSAGKSPNEAPTPFKRSEHSQPTSQINCIRSGVEYVYVCIPRSRGRWRLERDRAFYGQHEQGHTQKLLPWESLLPLRESL